MGSLGVLTTGLIEKGKLIGALLQAMQDRVAKCDAALPSYPPSPQYLPLPSRVTMPALLLEFTRQFEDADEGNVVLDLAQDAVAFIDMKVDG